MAKANDPKAIPGVEEKEAGQTMSVPWDKSKLPPYVKQERRSMPGTRKQPNSGRQWNLKGDRKGIRSIVKGFLIDNKGTEALSYKLEKSEWEKYQRVAQREQGQHPMLQIDVQDLSLTVIETATWNDIVLQMIALEEELERLLDERRELA